MSLFSKIKKNSKLFATKNHRFKELSPLCAQAGLYLASGPFNPVVRHFGLQLMEHTVKFKWNQIQQQEKLFIKVKLK